ncbi:DNA polymerase I [Pseudarcicella hirudinis]|uniref:DNA polymerase I n=1 Tax=Pseudarcicella hirudinis TaxID=1079859 RepID=A0A1I5RYT6_9BACT|nr:DNA polymerase I [Pseudarcicella hirudinis]SFP63620.1 DNA polymerase I [Pseudarcicella hirudinis]
MKKLFLLDAMALIYRAHFAFAKTPRITSKGLNTSAVFGFANTLLEVLAKEKPTHIGVAFDTPKPTFRHVQFEAYKAQRQEQPEDITIAIPYVKRLLKAMNIPLLILDGYEADDVIGTIAKRAARDHDDMEIYMMTPDKDYGQLVEERIKMYKPAFMGKGVEVMGPQEICDRWGIKEVGQVIDILGLMGDAVDNIPGIPGIGEKTAQKLIEEYGSVENLIANVDKLKGKQKENVQNFAQQGLLSKELATIYCEVPVPFDEEDLKMCDSNKEELSALLDELEFRTLRKRLLGEEPAGTTSETVAAPATKPKAAASNGQMDLFGGLVEEKKLAPSETDDITLDFETRAPKLDIHTSVHQYHLVNTPELRQSLIHFLSLQDEICFDTETTALDAVEADLVGLALAYQPGEAFYVPFPENREEAQAIIDEFKPVFQNEKITKIAQNIKYDLMVLSQYGVEIKGKLYDTMLAHYLIEPEKRHNMDILAETYLNYTPVSIEELIGKKGSKQGNMREVELEKIKEYASEDADITFRLKPILHEILSKNESSVKLLEEVEMPLTQVLADVEMEGVRLDTDFLKLMSKELEKDMLETQTRIFELAGVEFNISSPKQLGEILFEKLKLDPKAKKTKTGQYMTGEEILSKLEHEHEIARKILDFRELQKLKSTYVDALPQLISPRTGRIHTSFMQAVAVTGRLSSKDPNLQNIPIRTPRGREIRKAFIPKNDDFVILSADYSQIELRIMAAFAKDESMIEAFNQGRDIHATTAAKVFNVSLDQVTSDMRRKAKTVNFGIIYGVSAFGLAQQIDISRSEAKEIIDSYWREFPAIKRYMSEVVLSARENGFVETILGRRRYLRDINSQNMTDRNFAERNAVNAPIQGSAADMIKVAMIKVNNFIKTENLKSRMILTVHDELVFDAYKPELEILKEKVNELMISAIEFPVKMETGMGVGLNWLEAH